jgi:hypothetical protein
MSELLNRFSLSTAKWNLPIALCLLVLWCAMVACTISSICAQPFSPAQRRFWILVVIFLPLFGVLAYLPFSFRREDLPNAFMLKSKGRQKKTKRPGTITGGTQN